MHKTIGIDLGTTNSCVAAIETGRPIVIPNRDGGRTTPSVVAFTKQGSRLVGNIAKRQAETNPENTIYSVKRLIGKKFNDPTIEDAGRVLPYAISEAPNGDVRIKVQGREYSPQEISAFVLQEIKKNVEEFSGEEVKEAIITVPAYFSDPQRQATKDAGRIAGLEVLRIINEPTAACIAFNLNEKENKTVAVYDLGGGTFDVSILQVGDGLFEVIATLGDTYLGGEDMDHAVMAELMARFQKETGLDLSGDNLALQRLKEASEKAKCELSAMDATEINLPFIASDASGTKHLATTLKRSELEDIIKEIVDRTRKPCEEALKIAGLKAEEIDEVLLVGGQTRTPLVIRTVSEIFGKEPRRDKNPDEIVALGAALQAGILKGEVKDIVLLDAIPLSLGVSTKGNVFVKLIERDSAIPTQKSRIFTTVADNQDSVEVHVYQGERELADENISLGRFELVGIPPAPRGIPQIEVNFDINANGIVSVSATDLITGNEQKIVVNPSSGLSEEEIKKIVGEAEVMAEEDRRTVELQRLKQRLRSLLESNRKAFKEFGSMLEPGKQNMVEETLEEAGGSLSSGNLGHLQEALDNLVKASKTLSEVILYDPSAFGGTEP